MTAGLLVVLVVMLHNLFGLGIGYLVGQLLRLQRPKSVALSIEVGMQNSGLATSLAVMRSSSASTRTPRRNPNKSTIPPSVVSSLPN